MDKCINVALHISTMTYGMWYGPILKDTYKNSQTHGYELLDMLICFVNIQNYLFMNATLITYQYAYISMKTYWTSQTILFTW